MSIVILNKWKNCINSYPKWLNEVKEKIYVITPVDLGEETKKESFYSKIYPLIDYSDDIEVEELCHRINSVDPINNIIALQEYDIFRAASIRESLKIPGQTISSAVAFRDKVLMKSILKSKNINVDKFSSVRSYSEIIDFCTLNGYPVVLKPRDAGSSTDVKIVRDTSMVKKAVKSMTLSHLGMISNVMVERFIYGDLFHVDGFILNQKIIYACSFRFYGSQINFNSESPRGSISLSSSELKENIECFAGKCALALPHPDSFAFHAEIFLNEKKEFVLGEIGSRVGGTGINSAVALVSGYNPNELYARVQAGLSVDGKKKEVKRYSGWRLIAKRPGEVFNILTDIPFEWVYEFRNNVELGKITYESKRYLDFMALIVVYGEDEIEVEKRLCFSEKWYLEHTIRCIK